MLRALVERRIGRRDQANAWIWRLAEYTREVHEEYAVQRWPETKRLLGLLVNSAGGAHARNARRLVHAARKQDRRLAAALLAAALAHTPEAEEVLRGARTRMARKPPALARELLRNFPKRRPRGQRRRKGQRRGDAARRPKADVAAETTVNADARTCRGQGRREGGQHPHLKRQGRRQGGQRPQPRTAKSPTRRSTARLRRKGEPPPRQARKGAVAKRTSRRPRSSIPSARPWPPSQETSRRKARRAPARLPARLDGLGQACASAASSRPASARSRSAGKPIAGGALAHVRRQLLDSHGHVQADPQHRPTLLGASLDEDARELGEPGSLRRRAGPRLTARRRGGRRRSATSKHALAHRVANRDAPRARTAAPAAGRSTSEHSRELPAGATQARPWRPRPAVCSAAVTSVPWGAPAIASCAGPLVGRVGASQVHARMPDARCSCRAGRWARRRSPLRRALPSGASASSASTSPSTSCRGPRRGLQAMLSQGGARHRSDRDDPRRALALGGVRSGSPALRAACRKKRTVEEEVNVM